MADETFDAVVIGSGIGGMAAARLLAEFGGKRVLVLERHYMLGGMTHEFSRDAGRFHFGTGVHYLGATPDPVLIYLAGGQAQFHPLPDEFDILHFPGVDFSVPASPTKFCERLKAGFPDEAHAIDRFFGTVSKAARGLTLRNIVSSLSPIIRRLALPVVELLYPDTFRSIESVVARHFQNPTLKAIVSARWGLFGPPPSTSAFGWQALVPLQYYTNGGTHPVGGPKELGQSIIEGLEQHGVVLRARQHVQRIFVENGRAVGVEVEDRSTGELYKVAAPCIVSAVGARNTCALLDRVSAEPWKRELEKLPRDIATIVLFIGFNRSPRELGLQGENHWIMPDLDGDAAFARSPGDGILYASFSSLNNPAARSHTAEVLQFVDPDVFRAWRETEEGSRPDAYHALKAQLTQRLLDRLDAQWPGFKASVALAELATPLSFRTYQNSVDGGFYGLATSPERLRSHIAQCRTNIRGLYLSGQDAWGPGLGAALWGGIMSANAALSGLQVRNMWKAIRSPLAGVNTSAPWRGYLRVTRIETLTPSVKRIRFEPLQGGELPFRFAAGQYIKLDLPVAGELIQRPYSISSAPGARGFIEITVKREQHGLGSTFLHEELKQGEALRLTAPFGDFVVELARDVGAGRLLLIAGGVGITPIMSVLAAAAGAAHAGPITLLASFRSDAEVLFREEIAGFAKSLPQLHSAIFITGARNRIDIEALRSHVDSVTRVHLCGPASMMEAMAGALAKLEVPAEAIRTEAFISSPSRRARIERAQGIARAAREAGIREYKINMHDGRAAFPCLPGQTILAAAQAAHVPFTQSCGGSGICGTCRARVLAGPFDTDARAALSTTQAEAGWVLSCQTIPQGDLQITR